MSWKDLLLWLVGITAGVFLAVKFGGCVQEKTNLDLAVQQRCFESGADWIDGNCIKRGCK